MKYLSVDAKRNVVDIHPWIKYALDSVTHVTPDRGLDGRLYSKRLLEFSVRKPPYASEEITHFGINSKRKYCSKIWQCGRHVYASFKKSYNVIPDFLARWDAKVEQPFLFSGVRTLKENLLFPSTVCEYITHDQEGFLCYLNDVLTYVFASGNFSTEKSTSFKLQRGIRLASKPLKVEIPIDRDSDFATMTPRYIAFKSILIVRKSISLEENAEQEIINLPEDAKIMFCTGGNNYAVKTTSDDFWFHVKDLPNHTERDAAWRLVEAEEKASFWRTYNDVRNFPESQQPIFHYMAQTNSLNWFFYTRRFGNWYRASMEGLKLLSTHLLCDACQMEPVSVACGHGCGKAQYCGQECANAHYDIHVADTCDRVSEKK